MARKLRAWNRTFICVIYLSSVVNAEIAAKTSFADFQDTVGPSYSMKYNWFWKICSNWSTTMKKSDYSMQYPVVRYTEYAPSIEEFIAKYPYTTIEQCNRARSPETFGDIGTGCHPFEFESRLFNNDKYYNKQIVGTESNHITFDVGVAVGVGMKKDGLMLYLRPYTNGWIYSVGLTWRCLDFGLSVTKVTFQSQSYENKVEIVLLN